MEYYFIGEAELAVAFRLAGVEGCAAEDAEAARAAFRRATRAWVEAAGQALPEADAPGGGRAKVLILTEEAADSLGAELTEWQLSGRYPLVVELPGLGGRMAGRKTLVDAIREAVGIHV